MLQACYTSHIDTTDLSVSVPMWSTFTNKPEALRAIGL